MANYILNKFETLDAMSAQYLLAMALRWKGLEVCIVTPEMMRNGVEIATKGNQITYFTQDPVNPDLVRNHEVAVSVPANEHFLWEILEYPVVNEYMGSVDIPLALKYAIDYVSGTRRLPDVDAIAAYMTSGLPMEKRQWDLLMQCNEHGLRQHIPIGINLLRLERLIAKHYMPTERRGISIDAPGMRIGSDTVELWLLECDPITREYLVNQHNDNVPEDAIGYVIHEEPLTLVMAGDAAPIEQQMLAIYCFKFGDQAKTKKFAEQNGLRMNFAGYITYSIIV